jgi:hypothetical protein
MAAPAKKSSARIPAQPTATPAAPAAPVAAKPAAPAAKAPAPDARERYEMVAREAYYLAEKRGFAQGHDLDDWIAAEKAVAARLAR